jgi:hypothetical protein
VRQSRLCFAARARRPPWSLLQPDSGRCGQNPLALFDRRAGCSGQTANRGRSASFVNRPTPIGRSANSGLTPRWNFHQRPAREGSKNGSKTEIQSDIVQEIEALLGRQSIRDLDFKRVEVAARRQALRLAARAQEQRLNAATSDYTGPAPLRLRRYCQEPQSASDGHRSFIRYGSLEAPAQARSLHTQRLTDPPPGTHAVLEWLWQMVRKWRCFISSWPATKWSGRVPRHEPNWRFSS